MKLVFICQALDEDDPIQAGTLAWVRGLASRVAPDSLSVVTLRTGRYEVPPNVSVEILGPGGRLRRLARLYGAVARRLVRTDAFFIYQGGPYPLLLLPFRLLFGKPIFQWKAHPRIGPVTWFAIRFCDNKVFTSTPNALPIRSRKIRVVGQGIETQVFRPISVPRSGCLVAVGRISPVKGLDRAVPLLKEYQHQFGTLLGLDVYGPTLPRDESYLDQLEQLIRKARLSGKITIRGEVARSELPTVLNSYRLMLNLSDGALDRSVVEAMACGIPVFSTNASVADILPPHLRSALIGDRQDLSSQVEQLHRLLTAPHNRMLEIRDEMRSIAVHEHDIEGLLDRILAGMGA